MRLRWLWGDYIEPIELTREQRARIRRRINANADKLPNFWLIIGAMTLGGWVAVALAADPLGGWLNAEFPALGRASAHAIGIAAVSGPWTLACIIVLGVLYVPIGRRSMCECGVRVCIRCGYDLRGMEDLETICPECGSRPPAFTVEETSMSSRRP